MNKKQLIVKHPFSIFWENIEETILPCGIYPYDAYKNEDGTLLVIYHGILIINLFIWELENYIENGFIIMD